MKLIASILLLSPPFEYTGVGPPASQTTWYFVARQHVYSPGAVTGACYTPGAVVGHDYSAGAVAGHVA